MQAVPNHFVRFWQDPRTSARDRKRIVRPVIEDVTLRKSDAITANLRFKGRATRTLTVPLPTPLVLSRLTPATTLAVGNGWAYPWP